MMSTPACRFMLSILAVNFPQTILQHKIKSSQYFWASDAEYGALLLEYTGNKRKKPSNAF